MEDPKVLNPSSPHCFNHSSSKASCSSSPIPSCSSSTNGNSVERFDLQGEVATRSVTGSVRSTRRWASLRQHVSNSEGGKPKVELLLDPPGSKSSTPSSQPHTPNTPRTPHTPLRKSNWEVIEHFTGAPRPSIVTVSPCTTGIIPKKVA